MKLQNFSNHTPSSYNYCVIRLRYETYPPDYGYYVCGPILTFFIAIGLIGNLICITMFVTRKPMSIVSFYTVPLCISDCAVLMGSFFMTNLPHILYGRMRTYGFYVRLYPAASFFSNLSYTLCVWLIMLLSIERYFALCHPLKHRFYDAKRRSMMISVIGLIVATIYNIPRYFELDVFECFELRKKTMVPLLKPSHFRSWESYWISYKIILSPLLFSFGPLLLLCVLSFRIQRELKRSRQLSRARDQRELGTRIVSREVTQAEKDAPSNPLLSGQRKISRIRQNSLQSRSSIDTRTVSTRGDRERQRRILTYTMLCVLLKFLVCHSLPAIIDFCETVMKQEEFGQKWMENLVDTSTLLIVVNSSLNIFIYGWCNREFRERMRMALTPRTSSSDTRLSSR